jgi:hypothetical protein
MVPMRRKPLLLSICSAIVILLSPCAAEAIAQPVDSKRGEGSSELVIESIPETRLLDPAAIAAVHPLYRQFEKPPRLLESQSPQEFRGKAVLYFAIRLDESGKVQEVEIVDPPLLALVPSATEAARLWTFEPARKAGKPVRTWATFALDLAVDLEKPTFSSFSLSPIGKDDPIPEVVKEYPGETGLLRFPSALEATEGGLVSIEEVDALPTAKKSSWRFEPIRLKSRLSAVLQISSTGSVERVIPTGSTSEPFILAWVRSQASRWKIQPAFDGGVPQRSHMTLEFVAEYEITRAKDSAKRLLKKNLKGSPTS